MVQAKSYQKARLDFFLISNNLYTDVDSTSILPGYRTDHSLIYMSLEFGKFKKGCPIGSLITPYLEMKYMLIKLKEVFMTQSYNICLTYQKIRKL